MSFKNFIDTYYAEEYLSGEFTFGFELEGFHEDIDELQAIIAKHFGDKATKLVSDCSISNKAHECPTCGGWGRDEENDAPCPDCHGEGATASEKQCEGDTFEWPSPVFQLSPSNLSKVVNFFSDLNKSNFDVNESCGFHVHINMPNEYNVQEEWFWILCVLAIGDDIDEFFSFEGWDFFNSTYASFDFLNNLADALKENDIQGLLNFFSEEKYRVFRIHPQGTLEWRGPRGFIIHQDLVKKFFLKTLPAFVKTIAKAQHTNTLTAGSNTYNKPELFKILDYQAKNSEYTYKKNIDLSRRFDYRTPKELIPKLLNACPWLKKAKFTQLQATVDNDTIGKPTIVMYGGIWQKGDFYGIMNGGAWDAPVENWHGKWIIGFVGTGDGAHVLSAEEAKRYFDGDKSLWL